MKKILNLIVAPLVFIFFQPASASLMLEQYGSGIATPNTLGGYSMTDFALSSSTGSVTSTGVGYSDLTNPYSGSIVTFDHAMSIHKESDSTSGIDPWVSDPNNSSSSGQDWWVDNEVNDFNVFTTHKNLITLFLPEDTLAFSFNVGANLTSTGLNAWIKATEIGTGGGISKTEFNVSETNTPGFGIYADNSDGSCSTISSIIIEPDYWGVGNFSIYQGSCEVPEPSAIALFGIGLLGLGLFRRKII